MAVPVAVEAAIIHSITRQQQQQQQYPPCCSQSLVVLPSFFTDGAFRLLLFILFSASVIIIIKKFSLSSLSVLSVRLCVCVCVCLQNKRDHRSPSVSEGGREWSDWSEWGPCSRTCDGGATYQTRQCLDTVRGCPNGRGIRYQICNMQVTRIISTSCNNSNNQNARNRLVCVYTYKKIIDFLPGGSNKKMGMKNVHKLVLNYATMAIIIDSIIRSCCCCCCHCCCCCFYALVVALSRKNLIAVLFCFVLFRLLSCSRSAVSGIGGLPSTAVPELQHHPLSGTYCLIQYINI